MTQDEQHLDLLSIFHYVVGSLTAFFSCFPLIHVIMGIFMLSGAFEGGELSRVYSHGSLSCSRSFLF